MKNRSLFGRQRGMSIIESSLALIILGVAALVLWHFMAASQQQQSQVRADFTAERARDALLGFAFLNGRLPCPAADAAGVESCDGRADGFLPARTLGFPDLSAGGIRYAVPSAAAVLLAPAGSFRALVPAIGAEGQLQAQAMPLKSLIPAGVPYDGSLDFCAALADTRLQGSVAFSLSSTASGPFGPTGGAMVFSRSQVASQLRCASLLSVAGRAHFNTHLAAVTMQQSLIDYKTQFDISSGLYIWDVAQSVWFLSNSSYKLLQTSVKIYLGSAEFFGSSFKNPAPLLTSLALVPAVLTYTGMLASNLTRFTYNIVVMRQDEAMMNTVVSNVTALSAELGRNALLGSANRFGLDEQAGAPLAAVPLAAVPAGPWARGGPYDATSTAQMGAIGQMSHSYSVPGAMQSAMDSGVSKAATMDPGCAAPGSAACRSYIGSLAAAALR